MPIFNIILFVICFVVNNAMAGSISMNDIEQQGDASAYEGSNVIVSQDVDSFNKDLSESKQKTEQVLRKLFEKDIDIANNLGNTVSPGYTQSASFLNDAATSNDNNRSDFLSSEFKDDMKEMVNDIKNPIKSLAEGIGLIDEEGSSEDELRNMATNEQYAEREKFNRMNMNEKTNTSYKTESVNIPVSTANIAVDSEMTEAFYSKIKLALLIIFIIYIIYKIFSFVIRR